MKLGAMLVRDGRISQAQLDRALAHQAKVGGRLGTVFVELRMLDPDTLTIYLGLELGIPVATKAAMDRAKRAAVNLLSPDLAERFVCVPLVVQDRNLIVALRDPHDLVHLDELGAATGYRIIPRVACETRLYYYLERYYGIPRPTRFIAIGDFGVDSRKPDADDMEPPAAPLPGLPPPVENPVVAPPISERAKTAPWHPAAAATQAADEDVYDELALELEADESEPADLAEVMATPSEAAKVPAQVRGEVAERALTLDDAMGRMRDANSRSQIADAVIGFARGLLDVGVLLVVREHLAFGWRGFGRGLDRDRLETVLVPLEAPSIFKAAAEANTLYVGPASTSALHAHLFKILRSETPRQTIVLPVRIGNRLVNLLYGHRSGTTWVEDAQLESLRRIGAAASEAYVRLIAMSRQSQ